MLNCSQFLTLNSNTKFPNSELINIALAKDIMHEKDPVKATYRILRGGYELESSTGTYIIYAFFLFAASYNAKLFNGR